MTPLKRDDNISNLVAEIMKVFCVRTYGMELEDPRLQVYVVPIGDVDGYGNIDGLFINVGGLCGNYEYVQLSLCRGCPYDLMSADELYEFINVDKGLYEESEVLFEMDSCRDMSINVVVGVLKGKVMEMRRDGGRMNK